MTTQHEPIDHAWVHERIAASLAAGLPREEQSLFDAHIHNCPECFDAFTEAKDADRWLQRAADTLTPSPNLEQKILTHLQEKTMKPLLFPLAKRAGLGLAAAVALAATGVFAQYILHQNLLNNPLSKQLASTNDTWLPNTPFSPPALGLGGGKLDGSAGNLFATKADVGLVSDNMYTGDTGIVSGTLRVENRNAKDDIHSSNDDPQLQALRQTRQELVQDQNVGSMQVPMENGQLPALDKRLAVVNQQITERESYLQSGVSSKADVPTQDALARRIVASRSTNIGYGDAHGEFARAPEKKLELPLGKRLESTNFVSDSENIFIPGPKIQDAKASAPAYYSIAGGNSYAGGTITIQNGGLVNTGGVVALDYKNGNASGSSGLVNSENTITEAPGNSPSAQIIPLKSVDAVKLTDGLSPLVNSLPKQTNDLAANYPDLGPATQPSTTPPSPAPDTAAQSSDIAQRKIIRSGDVEFEVRSFEDAYATISSIVTEDGGYISSTSSDKIANGKVRGTIVVRVPPEKLDRFLLKLRALGDLKSQQIAASDVTKDYVDLESELRALRAMETRLIDLIKNGKGEVKDLVVAEQQLGEYRVRIEKIEGQIRYYNSQIAMATLNITVYEKDIQKPTAAFDQENVSLSLETEDVEKQYQAARKILDDAKARIIDSELKKADADQYAARIDAEVPPEQADFVAAQLKQIGTLVSFNRDRKQTTTGGTGEPTVQIDHRPTQFSISLYNLANIAPRQTTSLTIAVTDVNAAYRKILALVRKPIPAEAAPSTPTGRIVTSAITGQQPEQMSADIRADIRADQTDALLDALKQTGETLANSTSENPDTANVTSAKRGIQLHLVNLAAVPPRETVSLREVAQDVPAAYAKLTTALQTLQSAGTARIISSQLTQASPQDIHASLAFEVRRDALPAIEKAFTDSGIEPIAKNTTRSNDTANTLDSKVGFQITELLPADSLPPLRTTILGIEVDNVEKSMDALRASLPADSAKEIEYTLSREPSGQIIGRLIIEAPVKNSPTILAQISGLGGNEKTNQVTKNTQLPETQFAKDRFELTLFTQQSIVSSDKSLGTTIRSAASTAIAALLWSLWLILTGLLFLAPFLALGWLLQKFLRRRKSPTPTA